MKNFQKVAAVLGAAVITGLLSATPVHAEEAAETTTGTVTASALRVRTEPSLEAEQIGLLDQGSQVTILGQDGDWYQVDIGQDGDAYMFAAYIRVEDETEETEETLSETVVPVGEGELDLLAAIIQCEAGGESETGKIAVGAVIMNRVQDGRFPDTITGVVYQSGQFTPAQNGALAAVLSAGARSDCYEAALKALQGVNPVGDALYFNSGSGRGIQIGNQHFY